MIGCELELLYGWEVAVLAQPADAWGIVRWFKNGAEVPLAASSRRLTRVCAGLARAWRVPVAVGGVCERGLRPACQLGGAGDCVVLLGLKQGFARRRYEQGQFEDGASSYDGGFSGGCRQGVGALRYARCRGRWLGEWHRDVQHGVQLWLEPDVVAETAKEAHSSSSKATKKDGEEEEEELLETTPAAAAAAAALGTSCGASAQDGLCGLSLYRRHGLCATPVLFERGVRSQRVLTDEDALPELMALWCALDTRAAARGAAVTASDEDEVAEVLEAARSATALSKAEPEDSRAAAQRLQASQALLSSESLSDCEDDSCSDSSDDDDDDEEQFVAPWTLRVVYRDGATARAGVEIDSSVVVRRVAAGDELVATRRAVTADGVARFKVRLPLEEEKSDAEHLPGASSSSSSSSSSSKHHQEQPSKSYERGWISERLRGGARDVVCVVVRQVVRPGARPMRYKVVRPGGAMIRATSSLDGDEVGLAPCGARLQVAERLRLPAGTVRLRIVRPSRWAGWASDKEHIVRHEPSRGEQAHDLRARERARRAVVRRERRRLASSAQQHCERRAAATLQRAAASQCDARRRRRHLFTRVLGFGCGGKHHHHSSSTPSTDGGHMSSTPVEGIVSVSRGVSFVLDRRECGAGIEVSPDLLTATCSAPRLGRGLVLGSQRMRRGVYYWEVRVERATWGSVFVGVAARGDVSQPNGAGARQARGLSSSAQQFCASSQQYVAAGVGASGGSFVSSSSSQQHSSQQSHYSNSSVSQGWGALGFVNYRATQAFGAEALYGSYYGPGDVIGVLLDCEHGTLAFVKDGDDFNAGRAVVQHLGVAYANLWRKAQERAPDSRAGLYAAFGLKGDGDQLSLRGCKNWADLHTCLEEANSSSSSSDHAPVATRDRKRLDAAVTALRVARGVARHSADETPEWPKVVLEAAQRCADTWRESHSARTGAPRTLQHETRARTFVELDARARRLNLWQYFQKVWCFGRSGLRTRECLGSLECVYDISRVCLGKPQDTCVLECVGNDRSYPKSDVLETYIVVTSQRNANRYTCEVVGGRRARARCTEPRAAAANAA